MITIYTDGASQGNPGPGGYGVVILYKHYRKELTAGFQWTTNNRMELWAVIAGLDALKKPKQEVIIYSDSKYVIEAVEKGWLHNWRRKGFKGKKNVDLWQKFWETYNQHDVKFCWIKGHHGNIENEYCDRLAVQSAKNRAIHIDHGYLGHPSKCVS